MALLLPLFYGLLPAQAPSPPVLPQSLFLSGAVKDSTLNHENSQDHEDTHPKCMCGLRQVAPNLLSVTNFILSKFKSFATIYLISRERQIPTSTCAFGASGYQLGGSSNRGPRVGPEQTDWTRGSGLSRGPDRRRRPALRSQEPLRSHRSQRGDTSHTPLTTRNQAHSIHVLNECKRGNQD